MDQIWGAGPAFTMDDQSIGGQAVLGEHGAIKQRHGATSGFQERGVNWHWSMEAKRYIHWSSLLPGTLHRRHDLVVIVCYPLCIVRELGEASFEPLKFTHLVGTVR
jgi:hypothetical protein